MAGQILGLTKLNRASTDSLSAEPITTKYVGDVALAHGGLHAPGSELRASPGAQTHPLVHLTRVTCPERTAVGPLTHVGHGGVRGNSHPDTLYFVLVIMNGREPPQRSTDGPMKPNPARQPANPALGCAHCAPEGVAVLKGISPGTGSGGAVGAGGDGAR